MNQLNYRLSHPVAALQTNLAKDMDKYSRIRFDYASFDAQVFGKQPLMGANPEQEMSPFSDCELSAFYLARKPQQRMKVGWRLAFPISPIYMQTGILCIYLQDFCISNCG